MCIGWGKEGVKVGGRGGGGVSGYSLFRERVLW